MRSPVRIHLSFVVVTVTIFLFAGCATTHTDLDGTSGPIRVKTGSLPGIRVEPHVYQEANEFVVAGFIKPTGVRGASLVGHVHITVVDPQGVLLESVAVRYIPQVFPSKGPRRSAFHWRSATVPPAGSTVRIDYTEDRHDAKP